MHDNVLELVTRNIYFFPDASILYLPEFNLNSTAYAYVSDCITGRRKDELDGI